MTESEEASKDDKNNGKKLQSLMKEEEKRIEKNSKIWETRKFEEEK